MSKKLLYLIKISLRKKLKTKWFLIANILFFVLIVGLINIDRIIEYFGGDFEDKTYIYFYDNTNLVGDKFSYTFDNYNSYMEFNSEVEFVDSYDDGYNLISDDEEDNRIFVYLESDDSNYLKASIISNNNIDSALYQVIVSSLDDVKRGYALSLYGLNEYDMALINSSIEVERVKLVDDNSNNNDLLMSVIFPLLTLPVFMLTMFLVQMIGAEINEEKSTRGMEIIISNVSPKVHFLSKLVSGNVFVLLQGLLLIFYGGIGIFIRMKLGGGLDLESLVGSDVVSSIKLLGDGRINNLGLIIVLNLVLIILSFVGYSLLSAICASMTTGMEDYQQVQTPIIMISLVGYYLALMASMFSGSLFIKVVSYLPFISTMLSPALFMLGQIGIVDVVIAILVQIIIIYILVKYGLRIYKVGILNYSNSNIWKRMFKAVVNK